MSSVELERVVQFCDNLLAVRDFPDYAPALNGLQVESGGTVAGIAAAVDASEATINAALEQEVDLLIVHHGLFWGGLEPVVGPGYRKLRALIQGDVALYSAHLPLDAHQDVGNCAILARELGVDVQESFGTYKGQRIGWWGTVDVDRPGMLARLERAVGDGARVIPGGPERITRVAVVTGGGSSFLAEAANSGIDALVSGEAPHHAYHQAMELGVNLFLGGHYATETWGVRALAARVSEEFGLPWTFLDVPTGL